MISNWELLNKETIEGINTLDNRNLISPFDNIELEVAREQYTQFVLQISDQNITVSIYRLKVSNRHCLPSIKKLFKDAK